MSTNRAPRGRLAALVSSLRTLGRRADLLLLCGAVLVAVSVTLALTSHLVGSAPAPAPTRPGAATITTVLDRVRSGAVRSAELDEDARTLTVTLGPDGSDRSASAGALQASVPASYLRDTVAALVAADVPVQLAGTDASAPSAPSSAASADPATAAVPAAAAPVPAAAAGATSSSASSSSAAPASAGGGLRPLLAVLSLMTGLGLLLVGTVRRIQRREAEELAAIESARAGRATAQPGKATSGGPSRGKAAVVPAAVPDTRFADVAGCDEAIEELTEMVTFLRTPEKFTRTGAKAPKGALLVGPPGTGKTLLARAVAGEAGVPFYTAAGSDFTEMYVGVGAKRVRELFAAARSHDKAILFIDEIDAVARRRSGDGDHGNGETENTLVALLAEMDGFDASHVIVLAATNRVDILDPAITRPGRLDRKVEVPNPDRRGREKILAVHATGKPLAGVDLTAVARRTPGFSGAQLAALVNEACMEAVRRDLEQVTSECFDHAVATIAMGRARTSALVTEHDRQVTAWHEAGHTLAAYLQADADDPVQVTIIPRGPAGGVTWMSGNDDLFLPRRKAHAQLVTALAGRAAEEALLDGEYTQGAHGDLSSATDLAVRMTTQYGMTRLGYQVRDPRSAAGAQAVSDVVEELLAEAHVAATALLGEHRDFLAALAGALLEEETLTFAQVHAIAQGCGVARHAAVDVPPPPRRPAAAEPVPVPVPDPVPAAAVRPARRTRPLVAAVTALAARRRARAEQPVPAAR